MIALIDPFKEEMLGRGFSPYHLGIHVNMLTGEMSLIKSDEALSHAKEARLSTVRLHFTTVVPVIPSTTLLPLVSCTTSSFTIL